MDNKEQEIQEDIVRPGAASAAPQTTESASPVVSIGVNNGSVSVQQNINTRSEASTNVAPPAVAPAHEHAKQGTVSKGEKLYNAVVYKVLNYAVNLGISLWVTDVFTHGRGKDFFNKSVNNWTTALTKTGMSPKGAKWVSEMALGSFTLNSGGNILLVPTKYLEDNKRPLVHWFNKHVYHEKQLAADGHEETPDEIYIEKEQPKQSWGRMIGRRALGWGTTTLAGMAIDKSLARPLASPMTVNGELVTHTPGQKVFTQGSVDMASGLIKNIPGGADFVAKPAVQRYMGYAALDWIYTIITSSILHLTNGAGKGQEPKEIGDDKAPLVDPNSVNELKPLALEQKNILPAEKLEAEKLQKETAPADFIEGADKRESRSPEAYRSNRQHLSKASHLERAARSEETAIAMAP